MDKLVKKVGSSVLQLVNMDGDDPSELSRLQSEFKAIAELAQNTDSPSPEHLRFVYSAGNAMAELIQKIMLQEVDDTLAAIETVSKAAQALHELVDQVSQGQDPYGISFPAELGLKLPGSETTACNQKIISPNLKIELPENVDQELFIEFLSSLSHTLESLEAAILKAENVNSPENRQAIKSILHNLKGEAGIMGFTEMSSLCHDCETLLEDAEDCFPAGQLLAAKDWLNNALAYLSGNNIDEPGDDDVELEFPAEQFEQFQALEAKANTPESIITEEAEIKAVKDFVLQAYQQLQTVESRLFTIENNLQDEEVLSSVSVIFHNISELADSQHLSQVNSLAHAIEKLFALAAKGTVALTNVAVSDILEGIDQTKTLLHDLNTAVDEHQPVKNEPAVDSLIERINEYVGVEESDVCRVPDFIENVELEEDIYPQHNIAQEAVSEKLPEPETPTQAGTKQSIAPAWTSPTSPSAKTEPSVARRIDIGNNGGSTVKVTTGRLDSLINMVGELVIAQSMVSQNVNHLLTSDQKLARNARHLDKITRDLQELTMSMRMVPVQGVFQKMARLVRDLSLKANKQIEFVMTGAKTELDRNVVEAIADPLVHMVRNAIDHAIETPGQRVKAGKTAIGRIELKAYHQAGTIVIEIIDDGRGLNKDKILQKALDNGLISPGQEISDAEAYRLIFHPGLTTAEKVTSISGRGVGMDVVRKNVESLRGRIDIESAPGQGSRFSIHLPLTLAVIDGQIVTVGSETYIIPTVSIEQSLKPKPQQLSSVQGGRGQMVMVRDELLPLVKLYELFDVEPHDCDTCRSLVVVVAAGEKRCCLQVDSLLGQQQVVIKSLGEFFGSLPGVSGGAIMGDGNISLILDVPGLITLSAKR